MEVLSGFTVTITLQWFAVLLLVGINTKLRYDFLRIASWAVAVEALRQVLNLSIVTIPGLGMLVPLSAFCLLVHALLLLYAVARGTGYRLPLYAYVLPIAAMFPALAIAYAVETSGFGLWTVGLAPVVLVFLAAGIHLIRFRTAGRTGEFVLALSLITYGAGVMIFAYQSTVNSPLGGLTYLLLAMFTIFIAMSFALVGAERQADDTRKLLTAREAAEEALRKSEERFRLAMVGSNIGIWDWDLTTNHFYFSPFWKRHLGYADQEVEDSFEAVRALIHPEDLAHVDRIIEAYMADPAEDHPLEFRFREKSGTYRWVVAYAEMVRDAEGLPARIMGSTIDITERKAADQHLRDSEQKYREIFHSIQDAYFDVDWDGVITEVSPSAVDLGFARNDLIGRKVLDLAADPQAAEAVFRELAAKREVRDREFPLRQPNGQILPCSISASRLVASDGESARTVGTIRDISERKRAEEEKRRLETQLQQTQKLESLGVLAGGIAHDFNNLLAGILGNAELAATELEESISIRKYLQLIQQASIRAGELCRQLLAYSGKGHVVLEAVDLSALVEEMAQLIDVSVSKKCNLTCHLSSSLPPVEADATQLRQIVLNLLTNASEAIVDTEGEITLSTGVIECDEKYFESCYLAEGLKPGEYVYLEVDDNGSGMDGDILEKIFDPFFTTKFTGRGLGLAAVLGIVHSHNGTIRVISVPGRGTTFRVLFPVTAATAPVESPRDDPLCGVPGTDATILVVDDEEPVRTLTQTVLEKAGFRVVTAADGDEGVDAYRELAADITAIVLDVTMPRLNGDEALREIRHINPKVPIILTSGYNDAPNGGGSVLVGANAFLQKPYRSESLLAAIHKALDE